MSKKTVITIASAIIGFLILLLFVLWLLSIIKGKSYTYEQVEDKIVEATTAFYKEHPEILPTVDGKSTLAYETLVENGYIEPLSKLLPDGDSCSAEVGVIKSDNDYTYIPRLTCSDKYSSRELYEQIFSNNEVVTSGSGLYLDENGEYYFKGKVTNNYVALGIIPKDSSSSRSGKELIWQIISIDSNNNIKMRAVRSFEKTKFDDRYNEDKFQYIGYNDYETSLYKEYLLSLENREDFLTEAQKAKLVRFNLCVGRRDENDSTTSGSTECSVMSEDAMLFGVLTPYEYMRASLDENCTSLTSRSCGNLNFLSTDDVGSSWSVTAPNTNTHQVYMFDGKSFNPSGASNSKGTNLVVKVSEYASFKSGDGTINNPYRLFKAPVIK